MIIRRDGFAIGTKSKAVFLSKGQSLTDTLTGNKAAAEGEGFAKVAAPDEESVQNVASWGTDNLLPKRLMKDIESTGVLSAGIDTKARILIGKGPMPARIKSLSKEGYEELEFVANPLITDFLELNNAYHHSYAIASDLLGLGNAFIQIVLSEDRKEITGFKRVDPPTCRFSKMNAQGIIEWVYISADWERYASPDGQEIKNFQKVPLLNMDFPLQDLLSRTDGHVFMIAIQYTLTGRNYYATSPWQAAREWVKIAQSIPAMKKAMFNNQITLRYIVEIHPQFWEVYDPSYKQSDENKQLAIQDRYYKSIDDMLVGGENQYKSLFSTFVMDRQLGQLVSAVKVTAIDDKVKDGKLLPESGAANGEILFALCINPALVGATTPGGLYSGGAGSGSNIREAFLVQIMLGEAERRYDSRLYLLIKKYNKWPVDTVIRYPNQLLTTLNSGANTQPTA